MEAIRRSWTVLIGIVVGLWVASAVNWAFGLDGIPLGVLAAVLAGVGGAIAFSQARELEPMDDRERRDAIMGWSVVAALVAILPLGAILGLLF